MFYGEFDYKLDDKGRVAVPPRFRDELKDGLVLSPGPEKCLTAYTLKEWKKIAEQLATSGITRANSQTPPPHRTFKSRAIVAGWHET